MKKDKIIYVPENEINFPLWKFELNFIKENLEKRIICDKKSTIMIDLIKKNKINGYITDRDFYRSGLSNKYKKFRKSLSLERKAFGHTYKDCNKYEYNLIFKVGNNKKEDNKKKIKIIIKIIMIKIIKIIIIKIIKKKMRDEDIIIGIPKIYFELSVSDIEICLLRYKYKEMDVGCDRKIQIRDLIGKTREG